MLCKNVKVYSDWTDITYHSFLSFPQECCITRIPLSSAVKCFLSPSHFQSVELACLWRPHFYATNPSSTSTWSSSSSSSAVKQLSLPYLRQPAVLVRAVSHSRCRGLQFSSPPPAPLVPRSQPEWGTITSSDRACSAWSTISIFTESWDDRFHSVPVKSSF